MAFGLRIKCELFKSGLMLTFLRSHLFVYPRLGVCSNIGNCSNFTLVNVHRLFYAKMFYLHETFKIQNL